SRPWGRAGFEVSSSPSPLLFVGVGSVAVLSVAPRVAVEAPPPGPVLFVGVGSVAVLSVAPRVAVEARVQVLDRLEQAVERGEHDLERRALALLQALVGAVDALLQPAALIRLAELASALADDAAELVDHRQDAEQDVARVPSHLV